MSRKLCAAVPRLACVAMTMLVAASSLWPQSDSSPQTLMGGDKTPKIPFASSLPPGSMSEKATTACTECHEARIIVQQRLTKAAWTKEVDKMIKWGAVVDAGDRDALIDYLTNYISVDKPAYDATRTSSEKIPQKKNSRASQ